MTLLQDYADHWDALQRDPISLHGPAAVPMGSGFARYRRFHAGEQLVYVDDMEGRPKALTQKQYAVLTLALEIMGKEALTMRDMAARLNVAPSTVSRAMTKLQAWGILVYLVGRGRYAGLVIIRRVKGDHWDYMRQAAKDRVRRWSEAWKRRVSRLEINVAPYLSERRRGKELDSLYYYLTSIDKSATLTTQLPWTADDMAEIR